ncbi:VPLPA-CTERM sorting domain-containing protein [Rubellimicrobium aerolatum]|uniref:VPLPA-CTERM sorting domain-containing protein n=1 Tax=Rubellimicrobium aerolatum TaxID=490979 RepID=A0ABW0SF96_9RHOB|nr:VPLPA-CTERM sorting domain-containing protein [Rubellimicrobium aerolatum]MBP1807187.1 hypothetical protein [Rubellimicrobium aerolatum]
MMMRPWKILLTAAAAALSASVVSAATVTIFDDVAGGTATFDSTVAAAGGTVTADTWTSLGAGGTSIDRGAYTITRNDGGAIFPTTYGALSGEVIDIFPEGGGSLPRTDPLDYFVGGVTLTFDDEVNSLGFEVGDWATCCYDPTTDLYISFDDGAPILVASADDSTDGALGPNGAFEIFVAAFDDSGSFSTVSFWGNGIGEALYFGGEIRYALLDEGSLPPTAPIPVPAAGWLMLAALSGLAALRRRGS